MRAAHPEGVARDLGIDEVDAGVLPGEKAELAAIGSFVWTKGALVGLRFVEFDSPLSLATLGTVISVTDAPQREAPATR